MADHPENKLVDKRVAHRYLRKGRLDEKDYQGYLKGLPDLAEQAIPVEADLEHYELPEEDEVEEIAAAPRQAASAPSPAPSSGGDGVPPQGFPQA